MPTPQDEDRAEHQAVRASILLDDYDETLRLFMEQHVDEERLEVWGIPDTSTNPLAVSSKQLTTPGLYGQRPRWRHANAARNEPLIGPGGQLDQAGYHTRMQHVQYMTEGMGDYLIQMDVDRYGDLTCRPVPPQNVFVLCPPDSPNEPEQLWKLTLRWWESAEKWVYTWDVYDLGDPRTARPPSYRIMAADPKGGIGEDGDLSSVFLARPDGTTGPLEGDDYPWIRANGQPRFPFVTYHAVDSGAYWNFFSKRGLHRGTLTSAMYATFAGHCALAATGSMVLVAGLDPVSVDIHAPSVTTSTRNLRTIKVTPGAMIYHDLQEGVQPFVKELGPGMNLESVAGFASGYEMRQGIRAGLNPADAEKQSANPTSGSALYISRQEKREYSAQVEPLFRRADLDAVELAAIVLRAAGTGDYDETGYTVTYPEIPRSPTEEKERRERLQWEVDQGLISKAEEFQRLNPGASEADAVEALVSAAVANALIDSLIEERLAGAGLVRAAPMVPDIMPPPAPDEDEDPETEPAGTPATEEDPA